MRTLFITNLSAMSDANYKKFVRHHKKVGRGKYAEVDGRTATIDVKGTKTLHAFKAYGTEGLWLVRAAPGVVPARFVDANDTLPIHYRLSNPGLDSLTLLGMARNLCWLTGIDNKTVIDDMIRDGVPHLVKSFKRNFGNIVAIDG